METFLEIVYIIGLPGTGKSTLMRAILDKMSDDPKAELRKEEGVTFHVFPDYETIVLGIYDEQVFSGTDRLSKSIGPKFREWLPKAKDKYPGWTLLGEGERFSNNPNLDAMFEIGSPMELLHTFVDEETLEERRRARNNTQDPKWMKGMKTRITNLCKKYDTTELDLSDWDPKGGLPPYVGSLLDL